MRRAVRGAYWILASGLPGPDSDQPVNSQEEHSSYVAVLPRLNRLRHSAHHSAALCCSCFSLHLHAPDGTGAGLDRVHSAATRRGKHREDHADGGSHRQHHHQGQDGAGHREGRQPPAAAVALSWGASRLISVQPTGPWTSAPYCLSTPRSTTRPTTIPVRRTLLASGELPLSPILTHCWSMTYAASSTVHGGGKRRGSIGSVGLTRPRARARTSR